MEREFAILMSDLLLDEGFLTGAGPVFSGGIRGVDCRDIEETRLYCSADAANMLRSRLSKVPLHALHWIDSGDYHYLTALLLERITEPFELLLLDHHPDDQPLSFEAPEMLSCGSWVGYCRRSLPLMKSQCSIDCGPADCPAGDLPLYLSVDLDILAPSVFATDWDQGTMGENALLDALESLTRGRRVLGIDVCGGLSRSQGARDSQLAMNSALRKRLRDFLFRMILR